MKRRPPRPTPFPHPTLSRSGVAVYSIYAPAVGTNAPGLAANGQGSLNRLSNETGGRAFFHGTGAPISIQRFLADIGTMLDRKSTCLNSSHANISYAVFCLKK